MNVSISTALLSGGATKWVWYDPGTGPKFGPSDWFGPLPAGSSQPLWFFGVPGSIDPDPNPTGRDFRVIGYAQTFPGTASFVGGNGSFVTNYNYKLTEISVTNGAGASVLIGATARRVLTACATLNDTGSSDNYNQMLGYNWINVDGGFMIGNVKKGHISAHMKSASIPGVVGMWACSRRPRGMASLQTDDQPNSCRARIFIGKSFVKTDFPRTTTKTITNPNDVARAKRCNASFRVQPRTGPNQSNKLLVNKTMLHPKTGLPGGCRPRGSVRSKRPGPNLDRRRP